MRFYNLHIPVEDESYDSIESYYDYKCKDVRFPNDGAYELLHGEVHTYHISELEDKDVEIC